MATTAGAAVTGCADAPWTCTKQVAVAVMTDGTVAVEVASEHALVHWPFLSDITLIDALVKVFQLPPHLTDDQPNTHPQLGLPQASSSKHVHPALELILFVRLSLHVHQYWQPDCTRPEQ